MQGPLTGISSGSSTSSHKDLYETLVWWRSSHITNLHDCTMKLSQDRRRRTFQRIHKISLPRKTSGNQLKSAPRHDESDPTRRRCREGCASDVKIRTWAGSIQCAAPATRNHHHHHHHRHHHVQTQILMRVSQNEIFDPTAPATKNDLQKHLSFWPHACRQFSKVQKGHACHADEKVSNVLYRKPPQSKCPRTSHKGTLAQEFTAKALESTERILI